MKLQTTLSKSLPFNITIGLKHDDEVKCAYMRAIIKKHRRPVLHEGLQAESVERHLIEHVNDNTIKHFFAPSTPQRGFM